MGEKPKAYVLYKSTLKDVNEISKKSGNSWEFEIYTKKIDTGNLSEEQEQKQMRESWLREINCSVRIYNDNLYTQVERIAYKLLEDGCKENIEEKVLDGVLDTELRAVFYYRGNNDSSGASWELGEEDADKDFEYVEDEKEFDKTIKGYTRKSYRDNENIYLENIRYTAYTGHFDDLENKIKKQIKKFIRNNLSYCIKKGKIIIPEEYLNKGKEGIKEWRQLKASNNKSNSIEKKLLKQIYADKKFYQYNTMSQIVDKIAQSQNWVMPHIEVDGRFNKQRTFKLINQILGDKSKREIMNMEEEEIVKAFKEYWKEILKKKYEEVDKMEIIKYDR